MIRIKCPKCAAPLKVDEADAGGVGECTECGTRFRIPAAKVPSPVRTSSREEDEDDEEEDRVRSRTPGRDDEEEEEEDYRDDDEDEVEGKPRKRGGGLSLAMMLTIKMAVISLVVLIVLFVAAIFIRRLATVAFMFGAIGAPVCTIMIGRTSLKEGGIWALVMTLVMIFTVLGLGNGLYYGFLASEPLFNTGLGWPNRWPYSAIWLLPSAPLLMILYVVFNWSETKRFFMVWLYCFILCIAMFISLLINQSFLEARREAVRQRINLPKAWVRPVQVDYYC
jgi:hypothetical protein